MRFNRANVPNMITLFRIVGTFVIFFLQPLSTCFFVIYTLTGITDVLDGWIARKTKTASEFGAKLDSIADLLFYTVILVRVLPILLSILPNKIWCAVAVIIIVRISAYIIAAIKYRRFASLHTYLNKLTGIAVFFIPFLLITVYVAEYCRVVSAIAAAASLEELVIHLSKHNYEPNTKSIFQKQVHYY